MHYFCMRFYLVLCLIIPTAVHANWTVNSTPVSVTGGSINSSGQVVTMATYKATHPTKGTLYMDRLTAYNKGTTGTLAARRISAARSNLNPLGLLMTGTLLGVGMFLDSVTGDIYSVPPTPQQPLGEYSFLAQHTNATCKRYGSTIQAAVEGMVGCTDPQGYVTTGSAGQSCNGGGYGGWRLIRPIGTFCIYPTRVLTPSGAPNSNPSSPGQKPTDEEVHNAIFPPAKWNDAGYLGDHLPELLRDPVTNSPVKTQETANKAKEIENAKNTEENPAYEPTPAESVPTPSEDTNAVATTWPSFCAWAIPVCSLIDWIRKDDSEEPDENQVLLPEQQLQFETPTWSSGLGNGSCPAPATFSVFNNQFNFSFEPFCDLAGMVRYLVIMLAYLSASLIIAGVRKNVV